MLITIGGSIAVAVLFVIALYTGKVWLGKFVLGGIAVWFVFYIAMLFGVSLFSTEKTLALNEPKEFCGFYLDCHMRTAVTGVRTAKTLGDLTANGQFYIVKVKVFSNAKQATLGLLTMDANIVDSKDRIYARDMRAEEQLGDQPPFEKKISPVESFEREIVFDLPADSINPRLDMREGYGIDQAIEAVLIGDEDSILHKRNYFMLTPAGTVASK